MNKITAPATNAYTTRRLTFVPVADVAQNTRGASLPAGTPVLYDGASLLASVDGQNDYQFAAPRDEDFAMASTNPYATSSNPELQRHHWQNLAGIVASFRPEWHIDRILDNLWRARNERTFPELAQLALTVALNPKHKGPGAIGFAAAGVIEL